MRFAGFDVSVGRESETAMVAWEVEQASESAEIVHIDVETLPDVPSVVEWIGIQEAKYNFDALAIDAIGVGRGVVDYVNRSNFAHKTFAFIASSKASRQWETDEDKILAEKRFANLKTRMLIEMRDAARAGRISIPMIPYHERLLEELQLYKLKKMDGRWKSEDPKKSPDVADAAVVGYYLVGEAGTSFWLGS